MEIYLSEVFKELEKEYVLTQEEEQLLLWLILCALRNEEKRKTDFIPSNDKNNKDEH